MRGLSILLSVAATMAAPVAAETCAGDTGDNGGAIARWQSDAQGEDDTWVERTVARDGPLAIVGVVTQDGTAVRHRFDVYYGFAYVADLRDLMDGDTAVPFFTDRNHRVDAAILQSVRENLNQSFGGFVAEMDRIWRNPTAGQTFTYTAFGEESSVSVKSVERVEGFPDADGATDTVVIETRSSDFGETYWFSTEYCRVVRYAYDDMGVTGEDRLLNFKPGGRIGANRSPATPEALFTELSTAMNLLDVAAMSRLTHPDSFADMKRALEAAYRQGKREALEQQGLVLGDGVDLAALQAMSGAEIYERAMSDLILNSNISILLMDISMDLVGLVPEGDDVAHAVVKTQFRVRGKTVAHNGSIRIKKTDDGGWAMAMIGGMRNAVLLGLGVELP